MVSSIREILQITEEQDLHEHAKNFDQDLETKLLPLRELLRQNIMSLDIASLNQHMAKVEIWRQPLVRYLSFATAFTEHAKGETFLQPKEKGVTDQARRAHEKHLTAGFTAQKEYLEGLIGCVDSRCNMCKKLLGVEADGANYSRNSRAA